MMHVERMQPHPRNQVCANDYFISKHTYFAMHMMTQEKIAVSLNSEGLIQLWFDCFSFGLTADGVYDGWLTLGPTVYNAYIFSIHVCRVWH